MNSPIYLDHAATTPLDSRVLEAMLPYLTEHFGNPSSAYRLGREARRAIDEARQAVADILHASPAEILFTSSGTESDNLALRGVAAALRREGKGNHIIASTIEHHAILHTLDALADEGYQVTYLPVDGEGLVHAEVLEQSIRPTTMLVTIMAANNEVGTVQHLSELAAIAHAHGAYFHTDAVQAGAYLSLDVAALGVDLLSLSAHKFYGPKGTGLLYVRRSVPLVPQMLGGGQERNRRASTENVAGIVGLAAALRLAQEGRGGYNAHCLALRERLIEGILESIPAARLTGHRTQRLPNSASFCFAGIAGESILVKLDQLGICASSGSACTAGALEPSHVLTAIGLPAEVAHGSLRLSVGRGNTAAEIERVIEVLPGIVAQLQREADGEAVRA